MPAVRGWAVRASIVPLMRAVLALCIGLVANIAHAQTDGAYKVIAHPSVPVAMLTRSELSDIFLKKRTHWPDRSAMLSVDLPEHSEVRKQFTERVHRRSVPAVKAFWYRKIYSGRGTPPTELESPAAVVSFVQSRPGAIGYVPATMIAERVVIVRVRD